MQFTETEKKAFRAEYAPRATDEQYQLFISECERRDLIPGKHVVFSRRKNQVWDDALQQVVNEVRVAFITTVEALRLLADRSGKYQGRGPFVFYYSDEKGNPTITSQIPLGIIPHAVSVTGRRQDWIEPIFVVARYDAYVQKKSAGGPTKMWEKRGEEQTAKCAEAAMLRTVAPEECGRLFLREEMPEEESFPESGNLTSPFVLVPETLTVPIVNNQPAVFSETLTFSGRTEKPLSVPSVYVSKFVPPVLPAPTSTFVVVPAGFITNSPLPGTAQQMVDFVESVTPTDAEIKKNVEVGAAVMADPLPNAEQLKKFQAEGKRISRDVLPKAGEKKGGEVFLAFLLRRSGKKLLREITVAQWEAAFAEVATAGNDPAAVLKIVKG